MEMILLPGESPPVYGVWTIVNSFIEAQNTRLRRMYFYSTM